MNEVKVTVTPEDDIILEGYGVLFGGKDLLGDTFTKDTDYMIDLVPVKMMLYDHAKQSFMNEPIGWIKSEDVTVDDVGIFVRMQIDRHNKYRKAIAALASTKMLGISSGAIQHMIQKDDGVIKRWPLVEFSPTPTPCEPRTIEYLALKSLAESNPELKSLLESLGPEPEPEKKETELPKDESVENAKSATIITSGGSKMSEQVNQTDMLAAIKTFMNEWKAEVVEKPMADATKRIDDLSKSVNSILTAMQTVPAIKNAGFYTDDGGKKDPGIKNFADFLLAVKRNDTARLHHVYGATKDLGLDSGAAGGYLVPQQHSAELLKMSMMNSPISSKVRRIPVTADSGRWPSLDQYLTPTAGSGNVAWAGGVTATAVEMGATLTKTEPSFEMLEWRLHKVGGYTEVDNELIETSPASIEALLSGLFGIAIQAKTERNILRGTGVGEPLGILNSAAIVSITPATNNLFSWPDVGAMWSRFKSAGGSPDWLIHPSIWPDILTMELGSNGANAWTLNMQSGQGQNINGYPIVTSEHLPQANNTGGVILADLTAYLLFGSPELSIAYSEHAAFLNDQGTWRFTQRLDGMPWLRAPITLADPQGSYTVSPLVVHAD